MSKGSKKIVRLILVNGMYEQIHMVPKGTMFLSVEYIGFEIVLHMLVNPEAELEQRSFFMLFTDDELNHSFCNENKHLKSLIVDGSFTHLFVNKIFVMKRDHFTNNVKHPLAGIKFSPKKD